MDTTEAVVGQFLSRSQILSAHAGKGQHMVPGARRRGPQQQGLDDPLLPILQCLHCTQHTEGACQGIALRM